VIASRLLFLLLILEYGSPLLFASEHLSVLTEESFPFNYVNHQQGGEQVVGIATELLRVVLAEASVSYSIEVVPWVRAMQAINSTENVIVYSMTRTSSRENKFHWIGEIYPMRYKLFGQKRYAEFLPKTLEGARHVKVAVGRGGVVYDYLKSQQFHNLIEVNSVHRYLTLLSHGRVDLVPYNELTFGIFAEKHGYHRDNYVAVLSLDEISTSTYFALSKRTSPELTLKLKAAYNTIRANGDYKKIMDQVKKFSVPMLESELK